MTYIHSIDSKRRRIKIFDTVMLSGKVTICRITVWVLLFSSIFFIISCTKNDIITDNGEGITIEFLDGLNDNPTYQLSKDSNGFYILTLDRSKKSNHSTNYR